MGNLSFNSDEAPPLLGLAHHYLCLTPVETVTKVGKPATGSFPGGTVGATEYGADPKSPIFWLLIARLTIAEQDHSLRVGKTRNGVLQDLFHKPLVPHPSGERYHQSGRWIDHFSLPQLLTLTASEAPALIGLQAGTGQVLDPLIVELLSMLPEADC